MYVDILYNLNPGSLAKPGRLPIFTGSLNHRGLTAQNLAWIISKITIKLRTSGMVLLRAKAAFHANEQREVASSQRLTTIDIL